MTVGSEVDHCFEAAVRLAGAHSDTLEFREVAEGVFNEMPPYVDVVVDPELLRPTRMLRDDDFDAAIVQLGHNSVAIENLVGNQPAKGDPLNQRGHLDTVVALARHQPEAHQIAQRIGHREDFGRYAAF